MNKKGYYNEFNFINELNNRFFGQLNPKLASMLEKTYNKKFKRNDYIICWKSFKTDKSDIVVSINNEKKYISIKSGKNNSVHLEPISEFLKFLKQNGVPDELINIYYDYHYALDSDGKRISAKEYQQINIKKITLFNDYINNKKLLINAINRFLFEGTHKYNNKVDVLIYGDVLNFVCITKSEIIDYLLNSSEKFNSIHFSLLTLQPWTRNLNNNPKYEYRRDFVQVKWYRLEEIVDSISKS